MEGDNHKIQTTVVEGESHMSEQRRELSDTCVFAVTAEYVSTSSGSSDHPQQYYTHNPKLTTFEEKDFFLNFLIKTFFFTVTHLSEIISRS